MRHSRNILLAVLTLASGCTLIPRYQRPEAPVRTTFTVDPTGTNAASAVLPTWEEFFTDPRHRQLIRIAITNNRDLRSATLRVEQSRSQYRISRSRLFPRQEAGAAFESLRSGGDTRELWSASLGSTAYEVDLFGRVRSLNRQALEKFLATDEARKAALISLIAEVAAADLDLRRATRQVSLANETLGLVGESRALNQAAFEAGASNELDLRSADAQVESTRVSLIAAQLQATEARNRLELLLGRPLPDDLQEAGSDLVDTLVPRVPAGLPSDLLGRRPDILEAEHTLKAANANVGAARAAFLPTLRLTTSAGTSSDELSKLFGAGTGVWSFSPQVTVPIFTGGENRANLAAARVGVRIEVANYEGAIQRAFREVADTLASIDALEGQSAAFSALVLAQQRRFDLARARFGQGEDIYLNVLLAQQDLFTARVRSIDNTFSLLAGRIALFKGLGGGWQ